MRQLKALFFDLNGTLVDDRSIQESVLRTCADLAAARLGLNAARLLEENGEVWRAYWPEVEERWMLGVMDGATVSLEAWRRTLRVRLR